MAGALRRSGLDVGRTMSGDGRRPPRPPTPDQEIRFCRAADGMRLAYAIQARAAARRRVVLAQPPPARLAEPGLAPLPRRPRRDRDRHPLRRARLRDVRLEREDFSLEARVGDLEAILDATGFEQFALLGMSGGSAVAMAYARSTGAGQPADPVRHGRGDRRPGRPTAGRGGDVPEHDPRRLGEGGPAFRRVFTSAFIPDATEEQMRWFDDLQRMSTSPANAVTSRIARQQVDIVDQLAADHGADDRPPGHRRPGHDFDNAVRGVRRDPRRAPRPAPEQQPHPPGRRARVAGVHRRGRGVPRAGPPGVRRPDGRDRPRRRCRPERSRSFASPPTAARTTRSPKRSRSASGRSSGTCRTSIEARPDRTGGPRGRGRGVPPAPARLTAMSLYRLYSKR